MNMLSEKKQLLIFDLLEDGMGNRAIARALKISKNTVKRYADEYWVMMVENFGTEHYPKKGGYWYHKKHG